MFFKNYCCATLRILLSEPHEPNCRVEWAAAWLLLQKSLKSAINQKITVIKWRAEHKKYKLQWLKSQANEAKLQFLK